MDTKLPSIEFPAFVKGIRSSMGTWSITLELFESQLGAVAKLPEFYQKSVQVALVQLPDEE